MPKGDDILLGDLETLTTDTDGDGVSDMQERLEDTDPGDASDHRLPGPTLKPDAVDPRTDLDPDTLEREVGFDPTATMPDGTSIESSLKGLTNLDGSDLSTGANHFGVGEDAILGGRLDANSPLSMDRDPLAPPKGTTDSSGHGNAPPAGADLSSRAPDWDLVSGKKSDGLTLTFGEPKVVTDGLTLTFGEPKVVTDDLTLTFGEPKIVPTPTPEPPPPPPPPADPPKTSTDPDADPGQSGGISTGEELSRVVSVRGGDTDFVEGFGGGPEIEGDQPPVRYIDLVTDGGDDSGGTDTTDATPRGKPDAPVVHTINPDAGIVVPPPGGQPTGGNDGDDDDLGLTGISSAATADSVTETSAPGIRAAGSGGGAGIASVAPVGEDPTLVADVRDPSIRSVTGAGTEHRAPDTGGVAVDQFATQLLTDASLEAQVGTPTATGQGDRDGDGISDTQETLDDTNPNDPTSFLIAAAGGKKETRDTDGDGVPDLQEMSEGTDESDSSSYLGAPSQDEKMTRDTDGDGVPDLQEMSEGTDESDSSSYLGAPTQDEKMTRDTDGDGVPDLQEMSEGTDESDSSSYLGAPSQDEKMTRDTDGDGVPDLQEMSEGTDESDSSSYLGAPSQDEKMTRDTDGDGVPDLQEMSEGTDESDSSSYLGAPTQDEKMTRDSTASAIMAVPVDDSIGQQISIVGSDGPSGFQTTMPATDAGIELFTDDLAGGLIVDLSADPAPSADDFESFGHDFLGDSPTEVAADYHDDAIDG